MILFDRIASSFIEECQLRGGWWTGEDRRQATLQQLQLYRQLPTCRAEARRQPLIHRGVTQGESVDSSVANAIAAGPNLVSYDSDADAGYVDIPADDDNINRVVYEANSAVGLVQRANLAEQLIMVTTDGERCNSMYQLSYSQYTVQSIHTK